MLGYFIDLELNFHRNVSELFILLLFILFCSMVSNYKLILALVMYLNTSLQITKFYAYCKITVFYEGTICCLQYIANSAITYSAAIVIGSCVYRKDKLPMIFHYYFHLNQSKYSYDTRNELNFHPYVCKRNVVGLGYSTWVR